MKLDRFRGFIFDLDGVVYVGRTPVRGAAETLAYLRRRGRKLRFVTNNSEKSRRGYVKTLGRMGIDCREEEVIPSSYGTAVYLKEKYGKGRCFIVGGKGVVEELREYGFDVVNGKEGEKADFVVVGIDEGFNYEKLKTAMRAVRNGARFIATNPDRTKPSEDGLVPCAGAMIAALEACSGVKPEIIVGKPNSMLFEIAVKGMGLDKGEVAVVGDRVDTDIVGGKRFGLFAILVLAEGGDLKNLRGESRPDMVIDSINELRELL